MADIKGENKSKNNTKLFQVFGEFNSFKEINAKAKELKDSKNLEDLKKLAIENGIDEEDAEDYFNSEIPELTNELFAAFGKIDVEQKSFDSYEIMNDWIEYIKIRCQESKEMASKVREKGKSIKGCIAKILEWSFANCKTVDKEIMQQAKITQSVKLGIPSMGKAKEIISNYYLGK